MRAQIATSFFRNACGALLASLFVGVAGQVHAQTMTHRYSFNDAPGSGTFADSIGGADGTVEGNAVLNGSGLVLDGQNTDYGLLPSGMISGYTQVTLEFWIDYGAVNADWTRTIAFSTENNTGGTLDYTHQAPGGWQNVNYNTPAGGCYVNNPGAPDGQTNFHVTIVVNPTADQLFYYNGAHVASLAGLNGGSVPPLSGLDDQYGLLGRSPYDIDPGLFATFHEFRIYSGLLTQAQVALNDAAGASQYITSPGSIQSVSLTTPINPLNVGQHSQEQLFGTFTGVTNLDLNAYGGATYASGNANVATVTSGGLVTAVGGGTTTIVASYGGLHATNSVTVTATPAVLAHRYSFNDLTDSVGGANATLQGNAQLSGGQVVLDGSTGTYVSLPGGQINIASYNAITLETWITFGAANNWARIFEFGGGNNSSDIYSAASISANAWQNHRAMSEDIGSGSQTIDWKDAWANETMHVTWVISPLTGVFACYTNGVVEDENFNNASIIANIATNVAWLGQSPAAADPYLAASIDEFRIYNGALTPQEIALTDLNGPNSTNREPGTLLSVQIQPMTVPAYSSVVVPTILANYTSLSNFNLLPRNMAQVSGLVVSSDNPNVIQVLPNGMLQTLAPGTANVSVLYAGLSSTSAITVANVATLTHRYSFSNDASDSVGGANGAPQGNVTFSGGSAVLDGSSGTYVSLPAGLLTGYHAVTIDSWATMNSAPSWSRLWFFGDNQANEFYFAPVSVGGPDHRYSTGFPTYANNFDVPPGFSSGTYHITCILGDGNFEVWTNGVLDSSADGTLGTVGEVGDTIGWIGRSPYADPYLPCAVDEFRIYKGRLAPDEILASDVLGPNQPLSTSALVHIARSGVNNVLSWPLANAGFVVQQSSSLTGGWTTLTNKPVLINNTTWQVTLPQASALTFYRLAR